MVYVAGRDVLAELVVEDGLEGGDDADAAYVEELFHRVSVSLLVLVLGYTADSSRLWGVILRVLCTPL